MMMDGGMNGGTMMGSPYQGSVVSSTTTTGPVNTGGPVPEGAAGMTEPAQSNSPNMPNYAWPSTAPYPNFSAVGYPTAYPWQAWPNIGPPYPYPEVPLDCAPSPCVGTTASGGSTSASTTPGRSSRPTPLESSATKTRT